LADKEPEDEPEPTSPTPPI